MTSSVAAANTNASSGSSRQCTSGNGTSPESSSTNAGENFSASGDAASGSSTSSTQQQVLKSPPLHSMHPPNTTTANTTKSNNQDTVPLSFLKFEDVEPYFDLRLEDACEKLGISTTSMKKICRQWYIQRWPHRKLKSLQSKQEKIRKQLDEDANEDADKKLSLYVRLRLEEQMKSITEEITQIRSKKTYEERRKKDTNHGTSFDSSSSSSNQGTGSDQGFYSPHLQPQVVQHGMPLMHSPQYITQQQSTHAGGGGSPNLNATSGTLISPYHQPHSPYLSPHLTPQNVYHTHSMSSHHSSPFHNSIQSHSSPLISPHLSSHMSHLNLSSFQLNPEGQNMGTSTTSVPAFGSQQQYVSEYRSSSDQSGASSPNETLRAGGILSGLREQHHFQQHLHAPPPTALSEPHCHPQQQQGQQQSALGGTLPSFHSLMQSLDCPPQSHF